MKKIYMLVSLVGSQSLCFSDWSQYTTFPSHVICILRLKLGSVSKWVERNHSILFLLMDTYYFLDYGIKYIFAKFWQKLKGICFAIEEKDILFKLYRYTQYITAILNWYHLNWIMKPQHTQCVDIYVFILLNIITFKNVSWWWFSSWLV